MTPAAMLAWAAAACAAASMGLYVVYVVRGVWRRIFWESLALAAVATLLALASVLVKATLAGILVLAVVGCGAVLFWLLTSVVFRVPQRLDQRRGAALPAFRLPDENGELRGFQDLRGARGLHLVFYRGPW